MPCYILVRYPVMKFRRPQPFPWQEVPIEYHTLDVSTYNQIGEHINRCRKHCRCVTTFCTNLKV